ncbi:hypothetical protein [Desulfovibrio inopinatus]|uniref:hypothetical protein n=1 Tax=Desulfovibrio inopinatus TaxID=102109 RepID=UPI0003F7FD43|nr:hypothetical protein [Desulfovibrio inopinatus]
MNSSETRDGVVVAVMTLCVYLVAHRSGILSAFVINDDTRQQIFWMRQYTSPELYPPSILVAYAKAYVPYGVRALYWLGAMFMDPVQFTKVVAGGLFVLLAVILSGLGRVFAGRTGAFVAPVVVWLMPFFLNNISGGLSRAFAAPLLALFALGLVRERLWMVVTALLVMAICIPYIWVLAALASGLGYLAGLISRKWRPIFPSTWWHLGILGCMALPVWMFKHAMDTMGFGPLAGRADMTGPHGSILPLYTQAGRFEILPLPNPFIDLIYRPFEKIGLFLDVGLVAGIISLIVLAPFLVMGWRWVDWKRVGHKARPLIFLGLSSLLLYCVARWVVVKLFVPDRYVQYSVNIAYALGFTVLFSALMSQWKVRRQVKVVLLAVCCVAGMVRLSGESLYDYRGDRALTHAVLDTPVTSVFAGPPRLLDNVLTFGKRDVLFSFELAHPWNLGYWHTIAPRLTETLDALFAESRDAAGRFARKYRVDFMIVDPTWFHDDSAVRSGLFAPYADQALQRKQESKRFFFEQDRSLPRIILPDGRSIVDLRPLL